MPHDKKYEDIMTLIGNEIKELMRRDSAFYRGYKVELTSELLYAKKINYTPKTIYIVVKFLKALTYYNQTSLPVNLVVMGEQNSIEVVRTLIMDFVVENNLRKDETGDILQKYETPSVISNFNEIGNGFRSLFSIGAGFLISDNNNPITKISYTWESEELNEQDQTVVVSHEEVFKPLASGFSITNQLDSQPFFSSKNLVQSEAQVLSFSVNFQTYRFQNSHLFKVMLGMVKGQEGVDGDLAYNYNNTVFHLSLTFKDGSSIEKDMKVLRMDGAQPVDGLPTDNYSFMC